MNDIDVLVQKAKDNLDRLNDKYFFELKKLHIAHRDAQARYSSKIWVIAVVAGTMTAIGVLFALYCLRWS